MKWLIPFVAAVAFSPPAASQSDPGNVLILLADDLGVDKVGVYGSAPAGTSGPATPTLDGLAADGVLFRRAWANPVCSPTRATIQTGRYSFRTGIGRTIPSYWLPGIFALPLEEWTLPEMLDDLSGGEYAHAMIGKWHLGNEGVGGALAPNLAGWSHFSGSLHNLLLPGGYTDWTAVTDGVLQPTTQYATSHSVDAALAWIEQAPEPWVCLVAFNAPHGPFHAPPAELHTVDLTGLDPNVTAQPFYDAMVEAVDTEIGRLLGGLPAGQLADTTVIFTSDNGTPSPVSGASVNTVHGKETLFESGVRVPLIVSGKGVSAAGAACDALVNTTDLFATVAELAGAGPGELDALVGGRGTTLDSVSLLPYLVAPESPSLRKTAYAEVFMPNGAFEEVSTVSCTDPMPAELCSEDLGFGTGDATLNFCSNEVFGGSLVEVTVDGAPANGLALLCISPMKSGDSNMAPAWLPVPPWDLVVAFTDANGSFSFLTNEGKPGTQYAQALVYDYATGGYSVSNATKLEGYWNFAHAIRNQRYKLIRNPVTCNEAFYDLEADPGETFDLLAGPPLSTVEQRAYDLLMLELGKLLGP